MIIRIFRVRIDPSLRSEFESKFASISVDAVSKQEGFVSVTIGKPSQWDPDEYVMVSHWESEEALMLFCGESWSQPHIPEGMEKYVKECSVSHYHEF